MCVTAIVAIASSVVSFMSAQADYEARSEQWKQNYVNALASGRDEQKQLNIRMVQEGEAKAQRDQLNTLEGAELSAEAEVSASSAGVSGISLNSILSGINRKNSVQRPTSPNPLGFALQGIGGALNATAQAA